MLADAATPGWLTHTLNVPCGAHTIGFCLEVDEGDHSWVASFDNVSAECLEVVPEAERSWGALKGTYR